jgi:hypothetical protein
VDAVALQALLSDAPGVLSPAERQLLSEWLDRLAAASPRAPMRQSPSAPGNAQRQSLEELIAWASAATAFGRPRQTAERATRHSLRWAPGKHEWRSAQMP